MGCPWGKRILDAVGAAYDLFLFIQFGFKLKNFI
jgi:hypothetical protein